MAILPLELVMTIAADLAMIITLPLHIRLLYVLLSSNNKINLDPSFHTLMINACVINLLYSVIFCLIQEPASAGVFLEFYKSTGEVFAKLVQIQSTCLISLGSTLHVILGASRFTAIGLPLKHEKIWSSRRLPYLYAFLWALFVVSAIPLCLPGSNAYVINPNAYGPDGVEYALVGIYYTLYSSFLVAGVEAINFLFYVGMLVKFRSFVKYRTAATEARKMTRGVLRTTLAALFISVGSWIIIGFFAFIYSFLFTIGISPLTKLQFSATFRLLNVINNVLTPWVLIAAFSKAGQSMGRQTATVTQSPKTKNNQRF